MRERGERSWTLAIDRSMRPSGGRHLTSSLRATAETSLEIWSFFVDREVCNIRLGSMTILRLVLNRTNLGK